jgi:hypothetical protein
MRFPSPHAARPRPLRPQAPHLEQPSTHAITRYSLANISAHTWEVPACSFAFRQRSGGTPSALSSSSVSASASMRAWCGFHGASSKSCFQRLTRLNAASKPTTFPHPTRNHRGAKGSPEAVDRRECRDDRSRSAGKRKRRASASATHDPLSPSRFMKVATPSSGFLQSARLSRNVSSLLSRS